MKKESLRSKIPVEKEKTEPGCYYDVCGFLLILGDMDVLSGYWNSLGSNRIYVIIFDSKS